MGDQPRVDDGFVETTQVEVKCNAVLLHGVRGLVLDEASHRYVKAGVARTARVPPTSRSKARLPLLKQAPPEFHPRLEEDVHQGYRSFDFGGLGQQDHQRNRPLLGEGPTELCLPHQRGQALAMNSREASHQVRGPTIRTGRFERSSPHELFHAITRDGREALRLFAGSALKILEVWCWFGTRAFPKLGPLLQAKHEFAGRREGGERPLH